MNCFSSNLLGHTLNVDQRSFDLILRLASLILCSENPVKVEQKTTSEVFKVQRAPREILTARGGDTPCLEVLSESAGEGNAPHTLSLAV